ncbi:MAG: preprotein translocase subunit SecG [Candidatus Roizmanbacteria bacterium]
MKEALYIVNIILSVAVVVLILMQGRGAGLGSAWGGGGEMYQTRRGIEKFTMQLTVICIVLFFGVSLATLFIR